MTLQAIIEQVPHVLLEKVAEFWMDGDSRQGIIHKMKDNSGFEFERKVTKRFMVA